MFIGVKDIPMIIHLQFGFSQFISFREEDLWNFSQSEHIIGPGSHIEYLTGTKNSNSCDYDQDGSPGLTIDIYSKYKYKWYTIDIIYFPVVSSPGPKVHVNYCHHLASVVCCLSSVNFSHFKLLLRNHWAISL
jgi:hypothetical protein